MSVVLRLQKVVHETKMMAQFEGLDAAASVSTLVSMCFVFQLHVLQGNPPVTLFHNVDSPVVNVMRERSGKKEA
jgi:hypothetical protein